MGNSFLNRVIGALVFVFGVLIAYFTYTWVTTIAAMMPDTLTKVAYWIGYITILFVILLAKPYLIIFQKTEPNLPNIGIGIATFIGLSFVTLVIYQIVDMILAIAFFQTMPVVNSIISIGIPFVAFLGLDVMPSYFILRS